MSNTPTVGRTKAAKIRREPSFQEILDRDVPTAIAHAKARARMGDCSPLRLYYRHEAIALQSEGCGYDMTADGWIRTDELLQPNIPYSYYAAWVRDRAARLPIFA